MVNRKSWWWWVRWVIWTKLDDLAWKIRPRFPEYDKPTIPVHRCLGCDEKYYQGDIHTCGEESDELTDRLPPWHERPLRRELSR